MPKFIEFKVEGVDASSDPQASYKLCFDVNHLCDAEKETGFNLLYALRNVGAMSMTQLRALFCALLKTGHPKVSLSEAGQLLTLDMASVTDAVWLAIEAESGDEVLFRGLAKLAAERPAALVEMISRLPGFESPAPEVLKEQPPAAE